MTIPLTRIKANSTTAAPPLDILRDQHKDIPAQDYLNGLCHLAHKTVGPLFKQAPTFNPTHPHMQKVIEQGISLSITNLYELFTITLMTGLPQLESLLKDFSGRLLQEEQNEKMAKTAKLINKQMRAISLFLFSYESNREKMIDTYQHFLISDTNPDDQPGYFQEFEKKIESLWPDSPPFTLSKDFSRLISTFIDYRKIYLHQTAPQKIDKMTPNLDKAIRKLTQGTWFHGTRAVVCLGNTNFTLLPTGLLQQRGIIPFFGETSSGITALVGVNQHSLSGTSLDNVSWSIDTYAAKFNFSIDKEETYINRFLEQPIKVDETSRASALTSCLCQVTGSFPRTLMALQRLSVWNPDSLTKKLPALQKKFDALSHFVTIVETKRIPEVFSWCDEYYSNRFKGLKLDLDQLQKVLTLPFPTPLTQTQKEMILNNFPAVLGSFTLTSQQVANERLVKGEAALGKDLQILCVGSPDLGHAKDWVETHLKGVPLQIYSFDQLREAADVNARIMPLLKDIFSLKKIRKLRAAPPLAPNRDTQKQKRFSILSKL